MLPAGNVPTFDEKWSSFQDYERQVRLWMRMTHLDPSKRAAASILRANSVARQVFFCSLAATTWIVAMARCAFWGFRKIISRPGQRAWSSTGWRLFFHYRRAAQSVDEYIVKFDLLRRKAESRIEMSAGLPEAFVSILRMQNAVGVGQRHGGPGVYGRVGDARRRFFGSCGGAVRQDILITGDAHRPLESDKEREARATFKKAKKQGWGGRGRMDHLMRAKIK